MLLVQLDLFSWPPLLLQVVDSAAMLPGNQLYPVLVVCFELSVVRLHLSDLATEFFVNRLQLLLFLTRYFEESLEFMR